MFEYFIEEVGIVFTARGATNECPNLVLHRQSQFSEREFLLRKIEAMAFLH